MNDFEMFIACLIIPIAYIVTYIAGKYDILYQICKLLESSLKRIREKENEHDGE